MFSTRRTWLLIVRDSVNGTDREHVLLRSEECSAEAMEACRYFHELFLSGQFLYLCFPIVFGVYTFNIVHQDTGNRTGGRQLSRSPHRFQKWRSVLQFANTSTTHFDDAKMIIIVGINIVVVVLL
jgi:hypothetical protein